MHDAGSDIARLIDSARRGMPSALNDLLPIYRNYLRLLAQTWIDKAIQAKADPSDMVQETLLNAQAKFAQFRGTTEAELIAWLRQILARNIAMVMRRYRAGRRQATREKSLDAMLHSSSAALNSFIAAEASSPSHSLQHRETAVLVADALAELSDDHRDVIVLRTMEDLGWDEVAEKMGRSPDAVRVLWARALKQLRARLKRML